jgi:hypothetical protein
MAIRGREFSELGIEELWSKTIVDDTMLFSKLATMGRWTMFTSIKARPEAGYDMHGMGDFVAWGMRQLQYVHHCLPRYRLPMLIRNLGSLFALVWPMAFATGQQGSQWHAVGMLSLGLFTADALMNLLAKPVTELPLPWRLHLMAAPLWEALWTSLSIAAVLRRQVSWRGVRYTVDRDGVVRDICREDAATG